MVRCIVQITMVNSLLIVNKASQLLNCQFIEKQIYNKQLSPGFLYLPCAKFELISFIIASLR